MGSRSNEGDNKDERSARFVHLGSLFAQKDGLSASMTYPFFKAHANLKKGGGSLRDRKDFPEELFSNETRSKPTIRYILRPPVIHRTDYLAIADDASSSYKGGWSHATSPAPGQGKFLSNLCSANPSSHFDPAQYLR
ncbi:hypothetical protein K0M31_007029 [Melipona bicolor]|uniref:Uncharacterized protein n=1 Tax=Melipona bicolor TaxID=60889 RepID=A0AA40KKU9_9HYME|nr:hypothetical protein K0M31_007029 [Melipona bicolor]